MLRDGIDEYHALLTDSLAAESQGQLDAQLRERGLFFGERPLCSVLRPRFLSPTQYRFLQQRAAVVLRAFRKAHRAALVDDALGPVPAVRLGARPRPRRSRVPGRKPSVAARRVLRG